MSIKPFLNLLPAHEASLHLEHNPHKAYYITVEQHMEDGLADWISEEEKQKAIATQDYWVLQWYPRSPVFFLIATRHTI